MNGIYFGWRRERRNRPTEKEPFRARKIFSGLPSDFRGNGFSPEEFRSGLRSGFRGGGFSPEEFRSWLFPRFRGNGFSPEEFRSWLRSRLRGNFPTGWRIRRREPGPGLFQRFGEG